jgi:hypothetical protein
MLPAAASMSCWLYSSDFVDALFLTLDACVDVHLFVATKFPLHTTGCLSVSNQMGISVVNVVLLAGPT